MSAENGDNPPTVRQAVVDDTVRKLLERRRYLKALEEIVTVASASGEEADEFYGKLAKAALDGDE